MSKLHPLGYTQNSKQIFNFELKKNTDSLSERHIILDQMGGGKTGLIMSFAYGMYKAYNETKGKYGALPIVFVTKFEWAKVKLASLDDNIAPSLDPEALDCNLVTFPCCGKSRHIEMDEFAIEFNDLSVEDIGRLANMKSIDELGSIKALIKSLPDNYNISDFLDLMFIESQDGTMRIKKEFQGLYYIFSTLEELGLFDTKKYKIFDWKKLLYTLKPIIFSFGHITNEIYQALVGYLLRKLYDIGNYRLDESLFKYNKLLEAKQKDLDIKKLEIELTDYDKFLISRFHIAIFVDEAPKLFVPTNSRNLKSYPATYYFQIISSNDGRKLGFKYSFLVTQYIKDIYDKLRKRNGYWWFGNKVSTEDRDFLATEKIILYDDIPKILNNPKFCFSMVDMNDYANNINSILRGRAVTKIQIFRSPCGVF